MRLSALFRRLRGSLLHCSIQPGALFCCYPVERFEYLPLVFFLKQRVDVLCH
jgi:hypothetical protein